MNFTVTKNCKPVNIKEIPLINITELTNELIQKCNEGKRVIGFFGNKNNGVDLFVVLADDDSSSILITSTHFNENDSYESITQFIPSFYMFEREFFENFNIKPLNHPFLKPVRYPKNRADKTQILANYPFYKMEGEELHEVAVGPVHAGVIEPGHFRFMCDGEKINHLEIQLGYQHRGVEDMLLQGNILNKMQLMESVAGDSTIAYGNAFAEAIEHLSNIQISRKTMAIRGIALELERIGIHLGDMSAIANDIAYLLGKEVFAAIRTTVINTSLAISGSRFGRGLMKIGGVNFDMDENLRKKVKETLQSIEVNITTMAEAMFDDSGVLARLEKTGVVSKQDALDMGLVGVAAKACDIQIDTRENFPCGIYNYFPIHKLTLETGDVFARGYLRFLEIKQSIKFIINILDNFPEDVEKPHTISITPNQFIVSMTEGWRGEIVHIVLTDDKGKIMKYKLKDPSFNNWFGLAMAVRSNGISDFPLCNKSFNLSYCGFDL